MNKIVLIFLMFTFSLSASLYRARPYILFSENMNYMVEMTPKHHVGREGSGTVFQMNGMLKGDSLWSFPWYRPHYDLILSNDGEMVLAVSPEGYGDMCAAFRDGHSWINEYPKMRRKIERQHTSTAGRYHFIKYPGVTVGLSSDQKFYTYVLADKRGYVIDLLSGEVKEEFFDSTGVTGREYYEKHSVTPLQKKEPVEYEHEIVKLFPHASFSDTGTCRDISLPEYDEMTMYRSPYFEVYFPKQRYYRHVTEVTDLIGEPDSIEYGSGDRDLLLFENSLISEIYVSKECRIGPVYIRRDSI